MKRLFIVLLCFCLLMTACAPAAIVPSAPGSSASESAPSEPNSESPDGDSSASLSPPDTVDPVATGDYQALLNYLESANAAQLFRRESGEYKPLGRLHDDRLFSQLLYDIFAAATPRPLEAFSFDREGTLQFLDFAQPAGGSATLYLSPGDGGTEVFFEIADVLPEQRFLLDVGLTDVVSALIQPYVENARAVLLDDLIDAIDTSDPAKLSALTGWEDLADYAAFAETEMAVTACELHEDEDGVPYAILTVKIEVGSEWLGQGEHRLAAVLGGRSWGAGDGVRRLLPYEYFLTDRTLGASDAGALIRAANLVGVCEPFTAADALDPDLLLDLVCYLARERFHAGDEELVAVPADEVAEAASRFLCLEEYAPTDSTLYDASSDSYLLAGRGGLYVAECLTETAETGNGRFTVTQTIYADDSCIRPVSQFFYTFRDNGDGTCGLLFCAVVKD